MTKQSLALFSPIFDLIKKYSIPLRERWEKMTTREKRLTFIFLLLAGLYLVSTLLTTLFLDPYEAALSEEATLKEQVKKSNQMAAHLRQIQSSINERSHLLSSDNAGFSLISYLEQEARHSQISTSVSQMTPRNLPSEGGYPSVMVSLHLERVDLAHVLIFIARIQRAPHLLRITHISLERRFDQHDLLDVRLDVQSIQPS
jgi:general secretion pathway protein M